MSPCPTRKPKARRALRDRGPSSGGRVTAGLASILASTVLAAASIAADSPAHAAEIGQAVATSQVGHLAGVSDDHPYEPHVVADPGTGSDGLANIASGTLARITDEPLTNEVAEPAARVAEDVLKRQQEEALKRHQEEEAARRGAAPVAPNEYNLGAGWGARGSWLRYHTGVDLTAPVGTPVHAVANGVVGQSDAGGWAGVHAVIHHEDGSSLYAHMSSMTVSPGDHVTAGQVIGSVGNTGRSFGAHLHFEYYPNGAQTSDPYTASDPYVWLEAKGVHL